MRRWRAVTAMMSRRWPGNFTPSSRRSYGENCVGRPKFDFHTGRCRSARGLRDLAGPRGRRAPRRRRPPPVPGETGLIFYSCSPLHAGRTRARRRPQEVDGAAGGLVFSKSRTSALLQIPRTVILLFHAVVAPFVVERLGVLWALTAARVFHALFSFVVIALDRRAPYARLSLVSFFIHRVLLALASGVGV